MEPGTSIEGTPDYSSRERSKLRLQVEWQPMMSYVGRIGNNGLKWAVRWVANEVANLDTPEVVTRQTLRLRFGESPLVNLSSEERYGPTRPPGDCSCGSEESAGTDRRIEYVRRTIPEHVGGHRFGYPVGSPKLASFSESFTARAGTRKPLVNFYH